MERARLSIMLISVCVLSAACAKKAKMRTVPRQAPAATVATGAVPAAPAESPDVDPAPAPAPRPTVVATGPAPAPADPMTPLDDSGDNRREARPVPVRVARPDVRTGDGELNRPRPIAPPREENCNCDDVGPRERVVVPRPAPRPRPIVRERPIVEERIEQRQEFELDPTDVLHCRWEPTGKPMTYVKYDPITRTAWVQHGWVKRANGQEGPISNVYSQVRLVSGLPPYGLEGVSLVAKSGLPIAHLKPSGAGKIWYERNTTYPYESLFGAVPGAPQGQSVNGVCWTKSEPAKTDEPSGGG